jgi:regulator of RNase E activity RraA
MKMDGLTQILQGCSTAGLFDVLRINKMPVVELSRAIRALDSKMKLAGPVFPIKGRSDPEISTHDSLDLFIREVLSGTPPGYVIVCQPQDHGRSAMGDLAAEALRRRGVLGYFIDGGSRDADEIREIGFPVFCRYTSPIDIVGSWRLTDTNVPIEIDGVTVSPGDYILGDADGTLLIKADTARFAIEETVRTMATDSTMRTAIRSGRDPYEAFLEFGKL